MTSSNGRDGSGNPAGEDQLDDDEDFDPAEYDTMLQLERLESIEEEMNELGVRTLDEVRKRIDELNRELDRRDQG
jgi:hypothetical protein